MAKEHEHEGDYDKRDSTKNVTLRCYLLELPGELRNLIYDYVYDNCAGERAPIGEVSTCVDLIRYSKRARGLLQTCRQIQDEAKGAFWKGNRFRLLIATKVDLRNAYHAVLRNRESIDHITKLDIICAYWGHVGVIQCQTCARPHYHCYLGRRSRRSGEALATRYACNRHLVPGLTFTVPLDSCGTFRWTATGGTLKHSVTNCARSAKYGDMVPLQPPESKMSVTDQILYVLHESDPERDILSQ